jgi:hypothetical protein
MPASFPLPDNFSEGPDTMMKTLFLQPPSFDGFDGCASQVGNQKLFISRFA